MADLILNFWNLRNLDQGRVWGVHHTSVHSLDAASVASARGSGWWWAHEAMGIHAAASALAGQGVSNMDRHALAVALGASAMAIGGYSDIL